MLRILNEFKRSINSLTFALETNIQPLQIDAFEQREKLVLSSIVNERCAVAISTDVEVQLIDIQERNKKKLSKLQDTLETLMNKISTEKYKKKTKPHIKQRDLNQVHHSDKFWIFKLCLVIH